jgi:hypothetical protein
MLPKVSPNSSLKPGPTMPAGSVPRMSPTFFLTWYQVSRMSAGLDESFTNTITTDSPGFE